MALKSTIASMNKILHCIAKDLPKAEKGNKAASQRVRTCSIKFGKVSKTYRKESVAAEKKAGKKPTKKKTVKKAAKKKMPAKKKAPAKKKTTTKRKKRK